jgi:hypothetical protein
MAVFRDQVHTMILNGPVGGSAPGASVREVVDEQAEADAGQPDVLG